METRTFLTNFFADSRVWKTAQQGIEIGRRMMQNSTSVLPPILRRAEGANAEKKRETGYAEGDPIVFLNPEEVSLNNKGRDLGQELEEVRRSLPTPQGLNRAGRSEIGVWWN